MITRSNLWRVSTSVSVGHGWSSNAFSRRCTFMRWLRMHTYVNRTIHFATLDQDLTKLDRTARQINSSHTHNNGNHLRHRQMIARASSWQSWHHLQHPLFWVSDWYVSKISPCIILYSERFIQMLDKGCKPCWSSVGTDHHQFPLCQCIAIKSSLHVPYRLPRRMIFCFPSL